VVVYEAGLHTVYKAINTFLLSTSLPFYIELLNEEKKKGHRKVEEAEIQ